MNESNGDHRGLLRQALEAVEGMKARLPPSEQAAREPIAIVGAGCRFPGAQDGLDSYWKLLTEGRDAICEVPPTRWGGVSTSRRDAAWYAGLLDDIDRFDPVVFGISVREAVAMDPQHRIVLETAWEALENAGQDPSGLRGSLTGVFIGITGRDYAQIIHDAGHDLVDPYTVTGNASNAAAGRVSFVLGLRGPSPSIDTACSSSLSAIHLACQSLRTRDCRMALAGGVNALIAEEPFTCLSNWGLLAPDGRCKVFDERADGFVRAEGCGILVLKRLSDAVNDCDRILAVIRGSAVNHDGRSSGLTVPYGPAQEAVIRAALERAGLQPEEIDYVEAHGTGTALGDPIEAHALAAVLGRAGRPAPLRVGSVKANLGHLESASGVAGLLKVVLALQYDLIPPQLHFSRLSPHIDWSGASIEIPASSHPWPRGDRPRRAGVSSFGFSGTNAHVIVEEPPEPKPGAAAPRGVCILPLSARAADALDELERRYATALDSGEFDLTDACYTAGVGRATWPSAPPTSPRRRRSSAASSARPPPRPAGAARRGARSRLRSCSPVRVRSTPGWAAACTSRSRPSAGPLTPAGPPSCSMAPGPPSGWSRRSTPSRRCSPCSAAWRRCGGAGGSSRRPSWATAPASWPPPAPPGCCRRSRGCGWPPPAAG